MADQRRAEVPPIRVRPHPEAGWTWNVGHECSYVCGAGGCVGAGWRPTRRWAVRAARRYQRSLARFQRRSRDEWEVARG